MFVNVKTIINEYLERLDIYLETDRINGDPSNFRRASMVLVEKLVDNAEKIEFTFQTKDIVLKRLCENTFGHINRLKRSSIEVDTNLNQLRQNQNIIFEELMHLPSANTIRPSRLERNNGRNDSSMNGKLTSSMNGKLPSFRDFANSNTL